LYKTTRTSFCTRFLSEYITGIRIPNLVATGFLNL